MRPRRTGRVWADALLADKKRRELPPIVPVVFYQGKRRWRHAREFGELFAAAAREWPWTPRFEHLLVDQSQAAVGEVRGEALGRVAQLALMAAARRRVSEARAALLMAAQHMGELARSGRIELFRAIVRYVITTQDKQNVREFGEALGRHVPGPGGDMKTYAEELLQEGLQEGLRKGRQEGRHEGRQEGRHRPTTRDARKAATRAARKVNLARSRASCGLESSGRSSRRLPVSTRKPSRHSADGSKSRIGRPSTRSMQPPERSSGMSGDAVAELVPVGSPEWVSLRLSSRGKLRRGGGSLGGCLTGGQCRRVHVCRPPQPAPAPAPAAPPPPPPVSYWAILKGLTWLAERGTDNDSHAAASQHRLCV